MGIRLKGQTSGYVEIKAPATAADNTLTLPNGNGSSNQVLTTDGSGGLTFAAPQLSTDTTPQLGGDLDVNGNDIVTTSNGDIDLDPNGSGQVVFKGNATRGSGAVKLNCENNSHGILVKGPPHSAGANYTLTLPNDTGTSGQLLTTNGSGVTSWATVDASPTFQATADGAIADGDPVVIQADGTVHKAAATVTEHTPSNGSEINVDTDSSKDYSSVYNTGENLHVVFYRDGVSGGLESRVVTLSGDTVTMSSTTRQISLSVDDPQSAFIENGGSGNLVVVTYEKSGRCKAVASTITGSAGSEDLSPGSEKDVNDTGYSPKIVAVDNGNKAVICYENSGLRARLCEFSGTMITTQAERDAFTDRSVDFFTMASNGTNKILCAFLDSATNASKGKAVVGTISGTTLTFGTPVVFADTHPGVNITEQMISYDEHLDKFLIFYRDQSDSEDLKAIVATISGTSVTFGTPADVETDSNEMGQAIYDPVMKKHLLIYNNTTDDQYQVRVATISGTSVSISSATTLEAMSNSSVRTGCSYNPDEQRFLFLRRTPSNTKASSLKTSTSVTKLTTENYIGISNGAYADGATATVQIVGSVDDAQSGLTPGQSYFVQNDGSLALTVDAGIGSVFAGTAVSATKLIVKG